MNYRMDESLCKSIAEKDRRVKTWVFMVCAIFLFWVDLFDAANLMAQTSSGSATGRQNNFGLIAQRGPSPSLGGEEAEKWFNLGIESFRWKRNTEASAYFRKAVESGPGRDEYYFYLGAVEHELGRFDFAESTYSQGIELGGAFSGRLRLNRANLRVQRGRLEQARGDFNTLMNGALRAPALLGRANLNLQKSAFEEAAKDYRDYLRMDPASSQRSTIEKILALLGAQFAEQEEAERLARQRDFEEEQRRLAEETRLAEEAARRRRLLDEVLQSLSGSGEDTTSIDAGNEDLSEDFEDSELEE